MSPLFRLLTGWAVVQMAFAFAAPLTAHAAGIGLFGGVGSGSSDSTADRNTDVEFSNMAIGLVADTAVAKNKLFNYRFKVGYASQTYSNWITRDNGNSYVDTTLKGIALDNTFGFGVVRTPAVRVWAGPCVRLAVLLGDETTGTMEFVFGGGIAAVVGANFHVGPSVSLGIEAGYMVQYLTGNENTRAIIDSSESLTESFPFVNAMVLFRLKDDP